jgi:20S proteasome alpha/beta subunit
MTTIAANREMMAADRRVTDGDTHFPARKIWRIGDAIVGAAGDVGGIQKFVSYLEKIGKSRRKVVPLPEFGKKEAFEAIVLTPEGLFAYDQACRPQEIEAEFYAMGSGKQAALAALHMGANPTQAVEIACLVDNSSDGPVDTLTIGP